MLRGRGEQYKVTLGCLSSMRAPVSAKPAPVTPGTVFYWLGLAVLLIVMTTIIWNLFTSPASLGI
jgi:hypothetical protein